MIPIQTPFARGIPIIALAICLVSSDILLSGTMVPTQPKQDYSASYDIGEEGGAIVYRRRGSANQRPLLWEHFQRVFDAVLTSTSKLPFNRSVAILVGVGDYKSYDKLQWVSKDLADITDYLLTDGRFDIVYVLAEEQARPETVEDFMMNRFRKSLTRDDRLMFYYSGHGETIGGDTGYLLFTNAKNDDFAHDVLPISRTLEWSRVLPVKHALFIFDTCTAGLAFRPRGADPSSMALMETLNGDGSRVVITAGSGDQKTFEVSNRRNGVFTRALLDALKGRANQGFVTIDQLFGDIQDLVPKSALQVGIKRELVPFPLLQHIDERKGTFVLLSGATRIIDLEERYADALDAESVTGRGTRNWTNPIDQQPYVRVPRGTVTLGCVYQRPACPPSETPSQTRTFGAFYIGVNEVRVSAYEAFITAHPGQLMPPAPIYNLTWQKKDLPMAMVSWSDAQAFCRWAGGASTTETGRLPTEAEWEYAARGSSQNQVYPWGDQTPTADQAVFGGRTTAPLPVGGRVANPFGLKDVVGNVSEWTADNFTSSLAEGAHVYRDQWAVRGGAYSEGSDLIRLSARRGFNGKANPTVGFRCIVPAPRDEVP